MISQDEIKNLFDYKDGQLYWKEARLNVCAGDKAGYLHKHRKYHYVCINNKRYLMHRLIFLYFYGYVPPMLDHIDCDKSNNKIENLRPATYRQNTWNKKVRVDSKTGIKGVSFIENRNRYWARINIDGKVKHLGYFVDLDQAKNAYLKASKEHHKEFARN